MVDVYTEKYNHLYNSEYKQYVYTIYSIYKLLNTFLDTIYSISIPPFTCIHYFSIKPHGRVSYNEMIQNHKLEEYQEGEEDEH